MAQSDQAGDGQAAAGADAEAAVNAGLPPARLMPSVLLTGNIRREMFRLALPALGEQLLHSAVAMWDVWLAGQIGRDGTNAVGFASYISWLIGMLFMTVGAGATAVVARSIGAGRRGQARAAVSQALGVAALAGAGATALVVATAPFIARLVWGTSGPAEPMRQFLQIEALGHVFVSVTAIGIGCLRASGDTRTPLWVMLAVNAWNMSASATLVLGLGWGVARDLLTSGGRP